MSCALRPDGELGPVLSVSYVSTDQGKYLARVVVNIRMDEKCEFLSRGNRSKGEVVIAAVGEVWEEAYGTSELAIGVISWSIV